MRGQNRAFALILLCAALPGCGGDDPDSKNPAPTTVEGPQRAVLSTIDALQTASRSGDGRRICNRLFTPNLVRSIEKSSKHDCAVEVRTKLFARDASISVQQGIRVKGSTASAVIRERNGNISTLHFLKQVGHWRIDRVEPQKAG
jgi:hypothetical protein